MLTSNKIVSVRQRMAEYLLTTPVGHRIPPINTMKESFDSGTGTIQRAIKDLEEGGAAVFQSKQKQGTILKEKNVGLLWEIANLDHFMALMPLPNSLAFQGLASGFRMELGRLGIPFTILYTHGSEDRINSLRSSQVDIAILSSIAAEHACQSNPELKKVLTFDSGTYYTKDSVVTISRSNSGSYDKNSRVGIDVGSFDHSHLTKLEYPNHDQYVNVSYAYLPQAILDNRIDYAIWHKTALGLTIQQRGLEMNPLINKNAMTLAQKMSRACIVTTNEKSALVQSILLEIEIDAIKKIQQDVTDYKQLPVY